LILSRLVTLSSAIFPPNHTREPRRVIQCTSPAGHVRRGCDCDNSPFCAAAGPVVMFGAPNQLDGGRKTFPGTRGPWLVPVFVFQVKLLHRKEIIFPFF
jgi:hypothetical protein